jgi:hypothetical protein
MAIIRKANDARKGRKKLSSLFFGDIAKLWETEGEACLRRAMALDPVAFAAMVAKLMPQKIEVSDTTMEDVGDEQLEQFIDAVQRRIALRAERAKLVNGAGEGAPLTIEARAEPAHSGQPFTILPPVS